MSLLTFLGLRQVKSYNRTPLTLPDILHRTLVTGLAALSLYGVYLGYSVHDHVMTKGKASVLCANVQTELKLECDAIEALALKEAEAKAREAARAVEEAREQSLADAAQAALPKRS